MCPIPMDNPVAVEEVDPAEDLPHQVLHLVRGQSGGRTLVQVAAQVLDRYIDRWIDR